MNITTKAIKPHPHLLEMLFSHKSKVNHVFKDVLGLHNISHIAISYIDPNHELLTFSSTPSLEFNLFSSELWRFDKTYQPSWYNQCTTSPWQSLYLPDRYDELYYVKQMKHHYPIGLSLAVKLAGSHVVYSIASHNDCQQTQALFRNQHEHFHRIGEYCSNALLPLLKDNPSTLGSNTCYNRSFNEQLLL